MPDRSRAPISRTIAPPATAAADGPLLPRIPKQPGPSPHSADTTRTLKALTGVAVAGAVALAGIGFAGSYTAVRELAAAKGFGWFANVFPIGIDAGIVVMLALDLLLTARRMRLPLLRQTAWLLTFATVAFNGAAAEGPMLSDPLAVGMHAVIPLLFIAAVEAARHAVGRIADITADRHMESPRIVRWFLAPTGTARIWRRQRLWELRAYEDVIALEREALVFRAQLRGEHGRGWRRKAGAHQLLALKLARYGVPVADTLTRLEAERERPSAPAETAVSVERERPQPERPALTPTPAERPSKPTGERAHGAHRKPKSAPKASADKTLTDRRVERVRKLYDELGKRPEWTDIRDALTAAKLSDKPVSRPTAQRLRERVEEREPALAALGSTNVRPLNHTGS